MGQAINHRWQNHHLHWRNHLMEASNRPFSHRNITQFKLFVLFQVHFKVKLYLQKAIKFWQIELIREYFARFKVFTKEAPLNSLPHPRCQTHLISLMSSVGFLLFEKNRWNCPHLASLLPLLSEKYLNLFSFSLQADLTGGCTCFYLLPKELLDAERLTFWAGKSSLSS